MQLESATHLQHRPLRGVGHVADRLGAVASFLCAIHCAALPFVLAILPALGLGFLASHGFEHVFIICASALAAGSLVYGYRRHRVRIALMLLAPGLVLLWVGGFLFDLHPGFSWHPILVASGGTLVAVAHIINLRLVHRHEHHSTRG